MLSPIRINRAPLLTLRATVVAERLGFDWREALILGRAVAGLNAYAKGVRLGLFQPTSVAERKRRKAARHGETLRTDLLHRAVPAVQTPKGVPALSKDRPTDPLGVERYVAGKFGPTLSDARRAMELLAGSLPPAELVERAHHLFEQFRSAIPSGVGGGGAEGELDLALIEHLAGGR